MYTGDDFNYAELMAGDDRASRTACSASSTRSRRPPPPRSTASPPATAPAMTRSSGPTVTLSRRLFEAPTQYYKCGVVFLAWLNGFQAHFRMIGGAESARGILHYADLFRLADKAGLLVDPDLAAARMGLLCRLNGSARLLRGMRPNILFITADQWRGDCLGLAGHPRVRTPNLDALAKEGTAFLRHYTQATPCSPARACLYTGLYQMTTRVVRNGTPLDARHDTIAKMLRRAGYDPTLFGYTDQAVDPRTTSGDDPWLRTYEGVLPGFTTRLRLPEDNGPWLSWLAARGHDIPDDPGTSTCRRPAPASARPPRPRATSQDETETAFLTGEMLRWLGEQPADRPWCAHLSFLRPHPPFVVPEPFDTLYDPADPLPFARRASAAERRGAASARRLLARHRQAGSEPFRHRRRGRARRDLGGRRLPHPPRRLLGHDRRGRSPDRPPRRRPSRPPASTRTR